MQSVWLTYAWHDNAAGDVDWVTQELSRAGLSIRLDRWNLTAGSRLWDQIASFIQDRGLSDGWVLYATQHSLGSEACREEFAYALDRALHSRGEIYPVIGLFPGPVDLNLVPAAIRTRLFVSLSDLDWKERIVAALEGRAPEVTRQELQSYHFTIHRPVLPATAYVLEVRPRAGRWHPPFIGIPLAEKDAVNPRIAVGPAGRPPAVFWLQGRREGESEPAGWWLISVDNQATPTESCFLICERLPSKVIFGVFGEAPQFSIDVSKVNT